MMPMTQQNTELLAVLKRAKVLVELLTVRRVMDAGDEAIDAAGLNPWCLNEGLATGEESISADFVEREIVKLESR
jgi:hypothetical protein